MYAIYTKEPFLLSILFFWFSQALPCVMDCNALINATFTVCFCFFLSVFSSFLCPIYLSQDRQNVRDIDNMELYLHIFNICFAQTKIETIETDRCRDTLSLPIHEIEDYFNGKGWE